MLLTYTLLLVHKVSGPHIKLIIFFNLNKIRCVKKIYSQLFIILLKDILMSLYVKYRIVQIPGTYFLIRIHPKFQIPHDSNAKINQNLTDAIGYVDF